MPLVLSGRIPKLELGINSVAHLIGCRAMTRPNANVGYRCTSMGSLIQSGTASIWQMSESFTSLYVLSAGRPRAYFNAAEIKWKKRSPEAYDPGVFNRICAHPITLTWIFGACALNAIILGLLSKDVPLPAIAGDWQAMLLIKANQRIEE